DDLVAIGMLAEPRRGPIEIRVQREERVLIHRVGRLAELHRNRCFHSLYLVLEPSRAQPGSFPTKSTIRLRSASFGSRPRAAPRLSIMCSALAVAGVTTVIAGCDAANFRKNCAQVSTPNSRAQS